MGVASLGLEEGGAHPFFLGRYASMSKKSPWRSFIWFSSSCAASMDSDGREGLHLGVRQEESGRAGGRARVLQETPWEAFGTEKRNKALGRRVGEPMPGEAQCHSPVSTPTPTPPSEPSPPSLFQHQGQLLEPLLLACDGVCTVVLEFGQLLELETVQAMCFLAGGEGTGLPGALPGQGTRSPRGRTFCACPGTSQRLLCSEACQQLDFFL